MTLFSEGWKNTIKVVLNKSVKSGFDEHCKRSNLSPYVCSRDIKSIDSTEVLLGKKYEQVWDTKVPSGLLLISWLFFSLATFVVWVGKKNVQKCFRQNLHSAFNLLKFNTVVWEVLLLEVCTLCMKKKEIQFKKNLVCRTSVLETCRAKQASLSQLMSSQQVRRILFKIHDLWSYLCLIIWSAKDNGTISWTMARSFRQWQRDTTVSNLAEKRLYTMTFLQNIPPITKNLQCRDCISLRWVSVK